MRSILLFFVLWLPSVGVSQILQDQVFVVGEHYLEDKCEAQFYPTWSRLVFLSRNKFYLSILYGGKVKNDNPSDAQMGNYKIVGDTLYLTFTKAGYELSLNEYVEAKRKVLMKPLKFLITSCGEKVILRNPIKEYSYGSRDLKSEAVILHDIHNKKTYEKVREELKRE